MYALDLILQLSKEYNHVHTAGASVWDYFL